MHWFSFFEVCSGSPRVVDYRKFGATKLKHVSLDAEHAHKFEAQADNNQA